MTYLKAISAVVLGAAMLSLGACAHKQAPAPTTPAPASQGYSK